MANQGAQAHPSGGNCKRMNGRTGRLERRRAALMQIRVQPAGTGGQFRAEGRPGRQGHRVSRSTATPGPPQANRQQRRPSAQGRPRASAQAHARPTPGEGRASSLGQQGRDPGLRFGEGRRRGTRRSGKGDETAPPSRPATHCESAGRTVRAPWLPLPSLPRPGQASAEGEADKTARHGGRWR
jgi:hypothetical protein